MVAVAKSGVPAYSSIVPPQNATIIGLVAGEDIGDADPCYIKAADNKVYKALGAAVNEAARVAGWSFAKAYLDDPISLVCEGNFRYGAALTPGTNYFLGATGGLDTVASTGGTKPIAHAVDATRIRILPGGLM